MENLTELLGNTGVALAASFLLLSPKGWLAIPRPNSSFAHPKTLYISPSPGSTRPSKKKHRKRTAEGEGRHGRSRRRVHGHGGLDLPRQRHPPMVRPRHHRRKTSPPNLRFLVPPQPGTLIGLAHRRGGRQFFAASLL
jgi:hypothetical protein